MRSQIRDCNKPLGHGLRRWPALLLVLSLVLCAACSEDPDDDQNLLENGVEEDAGLDADSGDTDGDGGGDTDGDGGDGGDAGTDTDGGDTDADADGGDADGGDTDGDGGDADGGDGDGGDADGGGEDADVEEPIEYPIEVDGDCGTTIDLGQLDWGSQSLNIDFELFENSLSPNCQGLGDGPAAIYQLRTPQAETGLIELVSDEAIAAELRQFQCDTGLATACYDDDFEVALSPGTTYFLVVHRLETAADGVVEAELNFEEMPDCPDDLGATSCLDEATIEACQVLQVSPDIPRLITATCPANSCEGGRCTGDSCQEPIVVNGSFNWSGSTQGLFNEQNSIEEVQAAIDDDEDPTCAIIDEQAQQFDLVDANGRELVFEVPNLSAGDEIHIDAQFSRPDNLAVLVKQSCDNTSQCLAVFRGDEEMVFEAPNDGDFFVVVDYLIDTDGEMDLQIEVQSP